ncbi:MAG: hypothetical protein QHI48_04580 [Bacteroidota bacterium]|nr:hypothetical protein [Bacteroidota bacterium]
MKRRFPLPRFQPFLLACFATALTSQQLHPQLSPTTDVTTSCAESGASFNIHAGVGTTNGIRIGTRFFLTHGLSPELSIGYTRLSVSSKAGSVGSLRVDGYAVTTGLNWYSHPGNDVSPLFTALATYTEAFRRVNDYILQRRFSLTATCGAEFRVSTPLGAFFRLGPSVTFLSREEKAAVQIYLHFDGGFGLWF